VGVKSIDTFWQRIYDKLSPEEEKKGKRKLRTSAGVIGKLTASGQITRDLKVIEKPIKL
jgi:hypothetical protein